MLLEVGQVVEGKITDITGFGAFVELPDGKSGLVHISEVAVEYVKDIKDYLKQGEKVMVKILAIDPKGRPSLSIKKAQPPKPRVRPPMDIDWSKNQKQGLSFEDMMQKFKQDSDERMHDIKRNVEVKRGSSYKKSVNSY